MPKVTHRNNRTEDSSYGGIRILFMIPKANVPLEIVSERLHDYGEVEFFLPGKQ